MTGDVVYLQHILDAIERIQMYTGVGQDVFMVTPHWQDATIRQLEIIGEATKNLSSELRMQHPQVPWRRIAGLRDVLIHNYLGVDLGAVWQITQQNLPDLKNEVQHLLESYGSGNLPDDN
jgi:uncharacterized protein with HEPN domain